MSQTWKQEFLFLRTNHNSKDCLECYWKTNYTPELFHISRYSANDEINCFPKCQCGWYDTQI